MSFQVLLIADASPGASLIQELVSAAGKDQFQLERASRLSAGLARLATGGIDLVLVDLALPDSQGLETFISIQAQMPQTPTVVLCDLEHEEQASEAVQRGAQDYLLKECIVAGKGAPLRRAIHRARERVQVQEELHQCRGQLQALMQAHAAEITERERTETLLQVRNRELALLNMAGQAFSSTLDLDQVLATVLEAVRHLLDADICSIWLSDAQTGELVCRQAAGPQSAVLRGWRLALGVGIAGWVVHHGESLVLADVQSDERHFREVNQQTGTKLRSLLSVPLQVKEDLIGVLQVADTEKGRFGVGDLELLEPLASSAAIAVENARLYSEAQHEIAERRRAEHALRRERDFAESLVNTAQAIVLVLDLQGCIVRFNPYLEKLSGRHLQAVRGQDWITTFIPRREQKRVRQLFSRSLNDIQTSGAINSILIKDGRERQIEWYNATLKGDQGDAIGVLAIGRDITEWIRAEEALRKRNEELTALNAIATTISKSIDLDNLLNATLNTVLALTNMDGGGLQLLDESAASLALVAHRGIPQETLGRLGAIQVGEGVTGRVAQSGQATVDVGGSSKVEFSPGKRRRAYACVPLKSKDKVLGVLFVFSQHAWQPITWQVQLLTSIGNQLGVAVENARLTRQAAETEILREVNRLRSELIANVSHELRTPLGLIKIFCNLLTEDVELAEDARRKFLRNIEDEADKLTTLVNNLLNLSQQESGLVLLNRYPENIGQLAQVVVTSMQAQSDQHRLVLDFSDSLAAEVDAQHIEQVLRNLLSNAIKYAPNGGTITVRGRQRQGQVLVCVSDEGIGIPIKEQERIFERFYRVENEVVQRAGGVGLGLSVCRGIIQAHGGRIWVESGPGEGSAFYFTLPLFQEQGFLPKTEQGDQP